MSLLIVGLVCLTTVLITYMTLLATKLVAEAFVSVSQERTKQLPYAVQIADALARKAEYEYGEEDEEESEDDDEGPFKDMGMR